MKDARSLSQSAQEEKRRIAIGLLKSGKLTQAEVSNSTNVHIRTVQRWWAVYQRAGHKGLAQKSRRPRNLAHKKLSSAQEATIQKLLLTKNPDQLKLGVCLWSRRAVSDLIKRRYSIRLSVWSVGRLLNSIGFTIQRPKKRAYEQKGEDVRRWIQEVYPKVEKAAKSEKATIFWGDEMGLRSDQTRGMRGYAPKGQTPIANVTGRRFGCNVISILSNRGKLLYMVYRGKFNGRLFIEFLRRILKTVGDSKIYLIIDGHPVHKSKLVKNFVLENSSKLRIVLLPPYSPELNPDEYLNQDVKSNAFKERLPKDVEEMMAAVSSYLRSCQKQPEKIQAYFQAESVKYAA
jgi:transposase